jgi:hypothetical protein
MKPICDRIRLRIEKDAQTTVRLGTLILFGMMLAVFIAITVAYIWSTPQALKDGSATRREVPWMGEAHPSGTRSVPLHLDHGEDNFVSEAEGNTLLEPGDGRGIKPPKPVPPSGSPEASEYTRQHTQESLEQKDHPHGQSHGSQIQAMSGSGQSQSNSQANSTRVEWRTGDGRYVDPSMMDPSKFEFVE